MECKYCKGKCQKAGKQNNGTQKLYCSVCKKYQQAAYLYNACRSQLNKMISPVLAQGSYMIKEIDWRKGVGRQMCVGNPCAL
jgi:hypothetical protein